MGDRVGPARREGAQADEHWKGRAQGRGRARKKGKGPQKKEKGARRRRTGCSTSRPCSPGGGAPSATGRTPSVRPGGRAPSTRRPPSPSPPSPTPRRARPCTRRWVRRCLGREGSCRRSPPAPPPASRASRRRAPSAPGTRLRERRTRAVSGKGAHKGGKAHSAGGGHAPAVRRHRDGPSHGPTSYSPSSLRPRSSYTYLPPPAAYHVCAVVALSTK